jgi:hypothetical protein
MAKLVLGVLVALMVALGAGWLWGSSGRWDMDRTVRAAQLRSDLLEARSSVLGARVDLYNLNFGDASRHLEDAKGLLRRATEGLKSAGRQEDAKRLDPALARIEEAQKMAGRLDQGANSRAADAEQTIAGVITTVATK